MSDDDCKRMAEERGFRVEFCYWMRAAKLVGLHKGEFAFPVHAPGGDVVGCHHRVSEGRWKFDPKGNPMSPLVIGNLATARTVLVFESQWDAFAFMERMEWDISGAKWDGYAIIITRGAGNGRRVRGLIPEAALVLVVMQNDPPEEDGSPGAADKWLAAVEKAVGRPMYLFQPPPEHKDLNDWTRAGASRADLMLAWGVALRTKIGEIRTAEVTEPAADCRPFPTEALGATLAAYVREVARVERVPESLPACVVLGITSATLGKQLRGRLLPGKVTPANLYIVAAARSGVGKSEVARHCDGPLHSSSADLAEAWRRNERPGLLASRDMLMEQKRKLIRSIKAVMAEADECGLRDKLVALEVKLSEIEDQLIEPRLLTEDVTTQKLAMLLRASQEQMCVLSRDAGDVVNNLLGRNHKLDSPDESLFLKGYSLDPTAVDRVGRPSIQLKEPCLTVLLLTQPDKLEKLLRNKALREGGLMPRFLIHCTEALPRHMSLETDEIDPAIKKHYTELIDSLIRAFRCSTTPEAVIEATAEARAALVGYYNTVTDRRLGGGEAKDAFAARHAEQACRLALVLHAADHGPDAGQHSVELECAHRAIAIAEWFGAEQFARLTFSALRSAEELMEAVVALAGEPKYASSGIRARDVRRARIGEHTGEAMDLLEALVAEQRLEHMPPSLTGKGGETYRLPTT